jgi:hypothetical protein
MNDISRKDVNYRSASQTTAQSDKVEKKGLSKEGASFNEHRASGVEDRNSIVQGSQIQKKAQSKMAKIKSYVIRKIGKVKSMLGIKTKTSKVPVQDIYKTRSSPITQNSDDADINLSEIKDQLESTLNPQNINKRVRVKDKARDSVNIQNMFESTGVAKTDGSPIAQNSDDADISLSKIKDQPESTLYPQNKFKRLMVKDKARNSVNIQNMFESTGGVTTEIPEVKDQFKSPSLPKTIEPANEAKAKKGVRFKDENETAEFYIKGAPSEISKTRNSSDITNKQGSALKSILKKSK